MSLSWLDPDTVHTAGLHIIDACAARHAADGIEHSCIRHENSRVPEHVCMCRYRWKDPS